MRHLFGIILGIVMGAALFFGGGWGFHGLNVLALSTSPHLTSTSALVSIGALLGTGLLLGLLMAVPQISPLATALPGVVALAVTAMYVARPSSTGRSPSGRSPSGRSPSGRSPSGRSRSVSLEELLVLGGAGQSHGGRVRRDRGRDQVEVSGADFALVLGGGVTRRFCCEFGLLQAHVGRHARLGVSAGKVEHRVVQRMESGERDELELIAHLAEFTLELLDRAVVQVLAPVE